MSLTRMSRRRAALVPAAAAAAAAVLFTGCSSSTDNSHTMTSMSAGASTSGMGSMPGMSATTMPGMPGMPGMTGDTGLAASASGLTLTPGGVSLPAGQDTSWTFTIVGGDGKPVTAFEPDQTKLMHLYLVRNDLTGFQHVHPTMAPDGTWTATITALQPGSYRAYTQFTSTGSDGKPVTPVLSVVLGVPGDETPVPLPPAAPSAEVDGYSLVVTPKLTAGQDGDLSVTITKDGQPVTDLQPYLDSYAHLTAIHAMDLAFAHLHPAGTVNGDHGGPTLDFHAMLPTGGDRRLFLQFQTGGVLHTAAVTVHV